MSEERNELNNPVCSRCGNVHANDDGIFREDGNGRKLCQMCWEAVEDQMYWDQMKSIIHYGP